MDAPPAPAAAAAVVVAESRRPPPPVAAAAAAAPVPAAKTQSPPFVVGGGYWARFGWLPPENIAYLQEAMAAEEAAPVPAHLPEHALSFLEGGEEEEDCSPVEDPAEMEALLREYLQEEGVAAGDAWRLGASPLGGRWGVFAARVLRAGDVVMGDAPLVLGPRAGAAVPPVCVGCHDARRPLRACPRGCGLPVCAAEPLRCHAQPRHQRECRVLCAWRPARSREAGGGGWSPALLRALCAVRALALPPRRRRLLRALTAHHAPQHAFEVELVRAAVDEVPRASDAAVMALACRAMDANAFEAAGASGGEGAGAGAAASPTGRALDGAGATLRGLYPLAAMLNHSCTPNTMHGYDAEGRLCVRTVVAVEAGEELSNSYTPLLWATPARRHLLRFTKHFDCACARCADPQEGGAALSALRCAGDGCAGLLLPQRPLEPASPWACARCGCRVRAREAQAVQAVLGGPLAAIDACDPREALGALRRLSAPLPPSNHVLVELKASLVWLLGHRRGYAWHELPEELLRLKEALARELLRLVQLLRAGRCRLRGLLMYELHCALEERLRRAAVQPQGGAAPLSAGEALARLSVSDGPKHLVNGVDTTPGQNSDVDPAAIDPTVCDAASPPATGVPQGSPSGSDAGAVPAAAKGGGGGGAGAATLAAVAAESVAALAEAADIFRDDVTAPADLQQRVAAAKMARGRGGGV